MRTHALVTNTTHKAPTQRPNLYNDSDDNTRQLCATMQTLTATNLQPEGKASHETQAQLKKYNSPLSVCLRVEAEPSEVEGHLFPKVATDVIERLAKELQKPRRGMPVVHHLRNKQRT